MTATKLFLIILITLPLAGCGGNAPTSGASLLLSSTASKPGKTTKKVDANKETKGKLTSPQAFTLTAVPEPEQIIGGAGYTLSSALAADRNGRAIAVWVQHDDGNYNIYANRYTPEGGWESAEMIKTEWGKGERPQVTFDRHGNAMAYWSQHDGAMYRAYVKRFTPESGWEVTQRLDNDGNSTTVMQIAFDRHGNALAALAKHFPGAKSHVYARRYTPANGWESEQIIGLDVGSADAIKIAFSPDDTAIAIWHAMDGSSAGTRIYVNRYFPTQGWKKPVPIDPAGGEYPQIAFDGNGNAIAAWKSIPAVGKVDKIYAARVTTAGFVEAPRVIGEGYPIAGLQLAVDSIGNAIAVWVDNTNIFTNRYSLGSGWGSAHQLNTGYALKDPQIAMAADGTALAAWGIWDGGPYSAYGRRYTPAGGWEPARLIESGSGNVLCSPRIAIDRTGSAMTLWGQESNANGFIYARRFSIFGAKGTE
jgi:hypothetical protein